MINTKQKILDFLKKHQSRFDDDKDEYWDIIDMIEKMPVLDNEKIDSIHDIMKNISWGIEELLVTKKEIDCILEKK